MSEDIVSKWHNTGLLGGVSDKYKLATHLQNCHDYLLEYKHSEKIGSNILPAIRRIYDMDNHIEFHFKILADELYDKLIIHESDRSVWQNAIWWEVEIVATVSEEYAKKYASEYRVASIKKLFYDLEREKDWIERELMIKNWKTNE